MEVARSADLQADLILKASKNRINTVEPNNSDSDT